MPNVLFELDRLRQTLRSRGIPDGMIEGIVEKASMEITTALRSHANKAMEQAVEAGVNKQSADFVNELMIDSSMMHIITESGNTSFPEPPKPMLPHLLKNAKPLKDGSGVYKVVPVGSPSREPKKVSMNIYDAMKRVNAERIENAKAQYQNIAPTASKFRTATSKQDAGSQWVLPARDNDFSEELRNINHELEQEAERIIQDIVRSYEDSF
jgi:hypothetical protein